jgi:hypothetical protein
VRSRGFILCGAAGGRLFALEHWNLDVHAAAAASHKFPTGMTRHRQHALAGHVRTHDADDVFGGHRLLSISLVGLRGGA